MNSSAKLPEFASAGNAAGTIDVRLSYQIVRLFSEGLYASSNKAIEELVANSFDAGASTVSVMLPVDFHQQSAAIAILDDGTGMDADGLTQHWLIGKSQKRSIGAPPKGRQQIGKFGIGKLATYVLSNRLTHISKKDGKFYSTSMDFRDVDTRGHEEVEIQDPVKISLRELTEADAKRAVSPWTTRTSFKDANIKLFGRGSAESWTLAILSDLKEKVHEIQRGRLEWVLRTALPLRDDFSIVLDGQALQSSKAGKGLRSRQIIGKDIPTLSKPAPDDLSVSIDQDVPEDHPTRFGLHSGLVGRVSGYTESYKELLTNTKSDNFARSHGFFVYVRGRLINVHDGHFGIPADELRHGTFGRLRIVVHMDGLDNYLQSDRERIREGPVLENARDILRAIFNRLRAEVERGDDDDAPGAKLARKLAGSPTSLSRRPIVAMVQAVLNGDIRSRFIEVPNLDTDAAKVALVDELHARSEKPEEFVAGIEYSWDATSDDGIGVYVAKTGMLRLNGLHPFVAAFYDEFTNKASGLPLEIFAMAEVLLEAQHFQAQLSQIQIDSVMDSRDQLLRSVARETGRRTSVAIANALSEARNSKNQLEIEVVAAFNSLGFEAQRIGGPKKPDGLARANLGAAGDGTRRSYSVTLEAKSKEQNDTKVTAKTVGVSTVQRHRDDNQAEHAIVVAPAYEHTPGTNGALETEIKKDRDTSQKLGTPRTITAIRIDDLARLVRLRPTKGLGLARFRELLISCSLPEECHAWVNGLEAETVEVPPYAQIIQVIQEQQKLFQEQPVDFSALRVALSTASPPYKVKNNEEIAEICRAMSGMAGYGIALTKGGVELDTSPENVLAAIEAATRPRNSAGKKI